MLYNREISRDLSKLNLNFQAFGYQFKNYWCRVVMDESKTFNSKEHSHSFFELHLCLKGKSTFIIEGKEILLTEGDFLLLNRSLKHRISFVSDDFEKFVWGFEVVNMVSEKEIDVFSQKIRDNCFYKYNNSIYELLSLIFLDVKEKSENYVGTIRIKLFLLYTELHRMIVKTKEKIDTSVKKDNRMVSINSYIEDNILNNITIGDIAREFSFCEKQLSRICMANYKMSIGKYLVQKKMEKAKQLLEETDRPLSEISDGLGYSDQYAFSKAFKRYEGMSPIKFRNSLKL